MVHNKGNKPFKIRKTEAKNMAKQDLNGMLETIAKNFLGIGTLTPQNSDSLDFHEVSVWSLKAALEEAYKAGKEGK